MIKPTMFLNLKAYYYCFIIDKLIVMPDKIQNERLGSLRKSSQIGKKRAHKLECKEIFWFAGHKLPLPVKTLFFKRWLITAVIGFHHGCEELKWCSSCLYYMFGTQNQRIRLHFNKSEMSITAQSIIEGVGNEVFFATGFLIVFFIAVLLKVRRYG